MPANPVSPTGIPTPSPYTKTKEPTLLPTDKMSFEQFACWLMTGVLAGGGIYGYMTKSSMPSLIAGVGFGAAYGVCGHLIRTGNAQSGLDLSIIASLGLLAGVGPRAYRTRTPVPVSLATLATFVLLRMGYVSYRLRHFGINGL